MYTNFLDNSVPDRINLIFRDKNPDYIYQLISKHLHKSIDELKNMYKIELNIVRQRFIISGSHKDIYELFSYLNTFGMGYESVTADNLRIDLNQFFNKLK